MDVANTTPYAFHPLDATALPTSPALTLIVKGVFELVHGQPAKAKSDAPDILGDDAHLDDIGRSLRYASDLVPLKLRGEVLVNAVCYPPDGRPRTAMDVSIAVGPIKKTLRVSGDRVWTGATIGRTLPFETMPLRWERAFGGLNPPENSLGRGIDAEPDEAGGSARYLPNVEYFDQRVTTSKDRPRPAGFAPISPMWEPRRGRQGTRDQRWAAFRAPLPPKDFDPRYYNAAPDDQILPEEHGEGFFRGDEKITLTALHKEHPVLESSLPGKRLRVFVKKRKNVEDGAFVEVDMRLDTVHLDPDKGEMTLVWRRPIAIAGNAKLEIESIYIAEEDLASEPQSVDVHLAAFLALRPPKKPREDEAAVGIAEAMKVLKQGKADPKLVAELEQTKDPAKIFGRLMDHAQDQIRALEEMTAKARPPSR
jgi:hypothetical protein